MATLPDLELIRNRFGPDTYTRHRAVNSTPTRHPCSATDGAAANSPPVRFTVTGDRFSVAKHLKLVHDRHCYFTVRAKGTHHIPPCRKRASGRSIRPYVRAPKPRQRPPRARHRAVNSMPTRHSCPATDGARRSNMEEIFVKNGFVKIDSNAKQKKFLWSPAAK